MFSRLLHLNNNVSFWKVCCNHYGWNIKYRPLVLTNPYATMLYMNKNVLKTSKHYINRQVIVTVSNNSKIFLRVLWFLLLQDSPTTVLYLLRHKHQSINQVIENHGVCLLIFLRWKKFLTVKLKHLNISTRQLNPEINHGRWHKSEKGIPKLIDR